MAIQHVPNASIFEAIAEYAREYNEATVLPDTERYERMALLESKRSDILDDIDTYEMQRYSPDNYR